MIINNEEDFLHRLQTALDASQEAAFWKTKLIPAAKSILGVLKQLQKQKLLFNPEGKAVETLTLEEFLRWFDLVSLKGLAFTLDQSNQANTLLRTKIDASIAAHYHPVDIGELAAHLQLYGIDLLHEAEDFPNRFYVQHNELGEMLKRLVA